MTAARMAHERRAAETGRWRQGFLVPANNPIQAGFLGDYVWLAVDPKGRPQVVWADTRGLGGTVEEDIYYATVP